MLRKNAHGRGIIVGLAHRIEDIAIRVHGSKHRYSRGQGLPWQSALLSFGVPFPPSEVCIGEPGLVDVHEDLVGDVWLQEMQGPCLPQQDALGRVRVDHLRPDLTVSQAQVVAQHRADQSVGYLDSVILQDDVAKLSGTLQVM